MKDLLADLTSAAATDDLFGFLTRVVTAAAEKKFVVELLAQQGVEIEVAGPVRSLSSAVDELPTMAKAESTVRADIRLDEVLALLTATSQGALHGGWSPDLRARTLAVVFAGLSPAGNRR